MTTRREGRARATVKERRARLRAERVQEAELLAQLEARLGTDADGECRGLVFRIAL